MIKRFKHFNNFFNNLTIKMKLKVGFGLIMLILAITIGVSVFSIKALSNTSTYFEKTAIPITTLTSEARRLLTSFDRNINGAIGAVSKNEINNYISQAEEDLSVLQIEILPQLKEVYQGDVADIEKFNSVIVSGQDIKTQMYEFFKNDNATLAKSVYKASYLPIFNEATKLLIGIADSVTEDVSENGAKAVSLSSFTSIFIIIVAIIGFSLAILVCIIITRGILTPIGELKKISNELAEGNLEIDMNYHSDDELGQLAQSTEKLIYIVSNIINDLTDILASISEGDFTAKSKVKELYIGDFEPLINKIDVIVENLSNMFLQVNESADQVSSGSDQVASSAQALSQGATEQASSIEQLSATIQEISDHVKTTADNSVTVKNLSENVSKEIEYGNQQMTNMISAMEEITSTSNEINKIIKSIDDIAFQTNILALNAAVEAARAGEAGRGFAVVADEVRNLAGKSAESAKITATLIENSIRAVVNGTKIANSTADSLQNIVDSTNETTELIQNISEAVIHQSSAIDQVATGIDQISAVVQTNSATSEQSAAASEQLSAQAQMLKELMSSFKLRETSYKGELTIEPTIPEIPLDDIDITADKY